MKKLHYFLVLLFFLAFIVTGFNQSIEQFQGRMKKLRKENFHTSIHTKGYKDQPNAHFFDKMPETRTCATMEDDADLRHGSASRHPRTSASLSDGFVLAPEASRASRFWSKAPPACLLRI